jgi:hypothetical protein
MNPICQGGTSDMCKIYTSIDLPDGTGCLGVFYWETGRGVRKMFRLSQGNASKKVRYDHQDREPSGLGPS